MSADVLLLTATCLCIAAAIAGLVLQMARRARAGGPPEPQVRAPLPMRCTLPIAWIVEPLVDALLWPARRRALSRRLEALGIADAFTPQRWESMCVALAIAAGGLMLAVPDLSWLALPAAACGFLLGGQWLSRRRAAQEQAIARELPAWLDLMTVCVEAGSTLTAGLRLIVSEAPPGPLRDYFERVLREVRGGRPRAQSFSHVAAIIGNESLTTLASALEHAESSGMSLGQVLRAQGEQRSAERFARAEKLAMQAPVKMLGPLIFCIFPCTFIVIGVPIAVRLAEALGA